MKKPKVDFVMLVDDNDIDNYINKRIMELSEFCNKIIVMKSGKAALDYLKQYEKEAEKIPEIIFLDIAMPVVSGFDFLAKFGKLSSSTKDKCKIIILSSTEDENDLKKINFNQYVKDFFSKPLSEKHLEKVKKR